MNINRVALSALIVSIGLLIGRLSGFFREVIIANNFGASENTDFIVLLLTTPDFIVNLLMGGAMSMALVPEFKTISREKAELLYKQVSTILGVFGAFLSIIGYIFKNDFIQYLALGMNEEFIHANGVYFSYSLLALPFSFATGASLAYLNSQERFTITSLGTLIVNIIIVIFIFIASTQDGEVFLYIAGGLVLAAIFRWGSQVISIGLFPFCLWSKTNWLITKNLVKRYVYALLSSCVIFSLPIVVRTIASIDGEGILSLVNYSIKLVELPLVILSSAFSFVMLPVLSSAYADGDEKGFAKIASMTLLFVFFMSLMVLIPLNVHSQLVVEAVYGWGDLSFPQMKVINHLLSIYSLSLPFQCLNGIILAILSARRDTKRPFFVITLLGLCLFHYLLAYQPSVYYILNGLVAFHLLITLGFLLTLRFKHKLCLFSCGFKPFILCLFSLFIVFIFVSVTEMFVVALPPIVGVMIIGIFLSIISISLIFMLKKEFKLGGIKWN